MHKTQQVEIARRLYLAGGHTNAEIAHEAKVPAETVRTWIRTYEWRDLRTKMRREVSSAHLEKLKSFIENSRLDAAKSHVTLAEIIKRRVVRALTEINADGTLMPLDAREMDFLSRAAKYATEIESRAVGLDQAISTVTDPQLAGGHLVVVGLVPEPAWAGKAAAETPAIEAEVASSE